MPYRRLKIVPGEIYHVFNRSVARQPIFLTTKDYQRGLDVLKFYIYRRPPLSFSHYKRLSSEERQNFLESLNKLTEKQVELFAFCLMPNHFHLLIKEITEGGITNLLKNFQNSYAKYFNILSNRSGALFQSQFKLVRIETDEQLIHVARYVHLNPLTSYVINKAEQLDNYAWCSFSEYLNNQPQIISKKLILSLFPSVEAFKQFTYNQIDHQRKLNKIKHLAIE